MNPNDAIAADPQQRKLMEVSFEALQNGKSIPVWIILRLGSCRLTCYIAGVRIEDMAGTDTGIYVASFVKGNY